MRGVSGEFVTIEPRATLIIPVFNGEDCLPHVLLSLASTLTVEHRLLLSLNGCRDRSAALCAEFAKTMTELGADVRVLEIADNSRVAALNAAEALAVGHRLYLDQDVVAGPGIISSAIDALDAGAGFVTGHLQSRSPDPIVRAAYSAWSALRYVRSSPSSAGFYAISEAGRGRWGEFPEGLPDDKLARLHFRPGERMLLQGSSYSIIGATSFRGLIRARRRYHASSRELRRQRPDLHVNDLPREAGLPHFVRHPRLWRGAVALFASELLARAQAR